MTLSGGIPFSLVESAIIGLHGRPRNMAFRLNLVPGQASDHCYQRGHQRLFMALELSETATSSGRPRRSPREAEEEEYESSTNLEGNPDLFESTAPESATAKSKSAPLKAGNNVETLPSELRAARREKQKAIRTPTNTSRGRGRSGSGGLGYLPTPRSNDSNAGPSRLPDERSRISKKSRKGERCVFGSCNLNPATVVLKTSTQLGFPFPCTPEHINTMEKEINKRLDKLESFAINTNALAKNAREEFYKDTVVLRLRGLAHQVTLFKIQSLNQATIAQILTEVQATNACMDGMETHMDEMSNIISQRKLGNVLAGLRWARPWLQRVLYDIPYKIFRGIRNVPLGFYYHAIWS
ncbi:hypothetical protein FPRO04_01619 [Fusarium proliferatum]|nr:hypothetical protein FPRO03_08847 [Fusarium proliferatum]KAG4273978.1 hypothetical protein FPRO04_01619 [Fusarium proliferatum]